MQLLELWEGIRQRFSMLSILRMNELGNVLLLVLSCHSCKRYLVICGLHLFDLRLLVKVDQKGYSTTSLPVLGFFSLTRQRLDIAIFCPFSNNRLDNLLCFLNLRLAYDDECLNVCKNRGAL